MKKILIILTQDVFVRNFFLTDAFSELEKNYECIYVTTDNVKIFHDNIKNKKKNLKCITSNRKYIKIYKILLDSILIANIKKSSSFKFRFIMRFDLNFYKVLRKPFRKIPFRIFITIYNFFKILSTRYPLSLLLKIQSFQNMIFKFFSYNPEIEKLIKDTNPHLVVVANSGYDRVLMDSINICKKNKIKSLCLIDNWDNLSTKWVMYFKPDYLGVWGEQTKKHAIDIHGFKEYQCLITGNPRYQKYFEQRTQYIKNNFNFKYILFLGTSWYWDEESVLKKLDTIINNNKALEKIKILYRPHPGRHGRKTLVQEFDNIIYDPQILKILNKETQNMPEGEAYPDTNYYPSLLKNAEFVLGGPQTMMIETSIFGKYFLCLVHEDMKNYSNMKKVFNSYKHFRGVESISSMIFCEDIIFLEKKILEIFKLNILDINKVDSERNKILYNDSSTNYSTRLNECVNKILN